MSAKGEKVRRIEHYNSEQTILLVGEGDFSFSACLAKAFRTGVNMVATTIHCSQDELVKNHWSSVEHLEKLEELGCMVVYGVDVHAMRHHPTLKEMKFDIIIFNFPHAGHLYGFGERDSYRIQRHQELLRGFFKNAKEMLGEGGEVHVTHRDDFPYHLWEVKQLGEDVGLYMKEKVFFNKDAYRGYHNKRGGGIDNNKKFPIGSPFTFKFVNEQSSFSNGSDNNNIDVPDENKDLKQNSSRDNKIDGHTSGGLEEVTSSLAYLSVAKDVVAAIKSTL